MTLPKNQGARAALQQQEVQQIKHLILHKGAAGVLGVRQLARNFRYLILEIPKLQK